MTRLLAAIAALSLAIGLAPARAQDKYPSKHVTIVIPFAPGGSVDAVGRTLKPHLEQRLGQPVIVDYKGGAATTIGTNAVARANPDGYTIGVVVDAHTINPSLYKNLPYNTLTDIKPITLIGKMPLVLTTRTGGDVDSVSKLVSLAKDKPKTMTYASAGAGSINHLAGELFSRSSGADMKHIAYRGGAPAMNDLLGGHVQLMFMSVTLAKPQLDGGKIKAIAVTSSGRLPTLPSVPTFAESGFPQFEAFAWQGFIAPAGTPNEIVARLQADIKAVVEMPEVKQKLEELGMVVAASSPAEFDTFVRTDIDRWSKIVTDADIKIEQ